MGGSRCSVNPNSRDGKTPYHDHDWVVAIDGNGCGGKRCTRCQKWNPRLEDRVARFWRYIDKQAPPPAHKPELGNCWVWTGYLLPYGYGAYTGYSGKTRRVHRIAWELENGPIPDDRELDHICRNRACVRSSHLRLVNHQQNCQNTKVFGHCQKGHTRTPGNFKEYVNGKYLKRVCLVCRSEKVV